MEPQFDVRIDWARGSVAAVALLPRSHIDLPPYLARGSYLLRLNQIHRSLESNVYSSCLVCGVTPVLVEVRESRCSMKGDAHAQHRLRDARVLAKSDD